ncbi:MAG: IS4 family transposase [Trebonia sp.]
MRSAVTVVTTVITVAAGVFAPGHLGELTRIVPFELVDAVLDEEGGREKRVRLLPSRVGVYFLLALCLFPDSSYLGVWGKLTAGLRPLGLARPSEAALRGLCRRVGERPVKRLFEILAGPLGRARTPGVLFRGLRTVSFDGCKSVKVPDTAANRAWLGKLKAVNGVTGYPALCLMTLVETGTQALLGAVFGPAAGGETGQAARLLHLLDATMLVLMDRGFDGGKFLAAVAATKARFLVRLSSVRATPVLKRLPDGSFLSAIGGVKVRIIIASVTVTCEDGTVYGDSYRLATTLLDHREYPAKALIRLYHERWQHEITYLALRHRILKGRVLRSQDPAGIRQEMWALLALYQALRTAVTDAVQCVPGLDPDRASWAVALETARDLAVTAQNITGHDLQGDIGRAVLAALHGPRRPRVCARKVKSPLSRWNKHPAGKPRTSKRITAITSSIITDFAAAAARAESPAGGNAHAAAPGETEGAGRPGTGTRCARPREAAGHASRAGSRAGAAVPDTATLSAGKTAHRRPSAARRPKTPLRSRPQQRDQAKRRVTATAGTTPRNQGNAGSRTTSTNPKTLEPLDAASESLSARHCD